MNIANLIRKGVKTADSITKSAQITVQHKAWIGQSTDGFGTPLYSSPVDVLAVVEYEHKPTLTLSGREIDSFAYLVFPRDLEPNGASGRNEPIDRRDLIILPDGSFGPIIDVKGVADPKTSRPYAIEVWLGEPHFDDRISR